MFKNKVMLINKWLKINVLGLFVFLCFIEVVLYVFIDKYVVVIDR